MACEVNPLSPRLLWWRVRGPNDLVHWNQDLPTLSTQESLGFSSPRVCVFQLSPGWGAAAGSQVEFEDET